MKPINYDKVFNWRIWWYTKWITGAILVIVIWSIIALGRPTVNDFNEKSLFILNEIKIRFINFVKCLTNGIK